MDVAFVVLDAPSSPRDTDCAMTTENSKRPTLVVTIEGHGVSPGEVSARDLAELLQATHQLIGATATKAVPSLVEVRVGSAAYAFAATEAHDDEAFASAASAVFDYASARGDGAPPEARRALLRLHKVAAAHGALALRIDADGARRREQRVIAPPLDLVGVHLRATTTLHGAIVGVEQMRDAWRVKLKTDAGKLEMSASRHLAIQAGRLLGHDARATVRSLWETRTDAEAELELIDLEEWSRSSLVDAMREVRREIEDAGIHIDGAALEREMFGDES